MRNTIKVERAKLKMTQQDLAERAGVSRQTINSIEAERYVPSTVLALKISVVFKTTVNEMDVLGVVPDKHCLEMAMHIKIGVDALAAGYSRLGSRPEEAAADADAARKAERKVEKAYRRAIADLFQGEDYINMFKRREIYRHLSNAADRLANCANTLHDIVVKMC